MALRLAKAPHSQILICIEHGVWGSEKNYLHRWATGDQFVLIAEQLIALGTVEGSYTHDNTLIFEDGLYPHRIPVRFSHLVEGESAEHVRRRIAELMRAEYGNAYGVVVLGQMVVRDSVAPEIEAAITSEPDTLASALADLGGYRQRFPNPQKRRTRRFGKHSFVNHVEEPNSEKQTTETPKARPSKRNSSRKQYRLVRFKLKVLNWDGLMAPFKVTGADGWTMEVVVRDDEIFEARVDSFWRELDKAYAGQAKVEEITLAWKARDH